MEAYLLGSIGDKYRIYDRTPGAKVKFYDYPKQIVEEAFKKKKIRFNGLDIDNNANHRKLTIHTNGLDTVDLNDVSARPFFLIDIVKTGHMEYAVEAVNALKCQNVKVDLNEIAKYIGYKGINIFYNLSFLSFPSYDEKDKSLIHLKNGVTYKLVGAIKESDKPIVIKQNSKSNEDKLAYLKLGLIVDSCDDVVKGIYNYGEVECSRWYRIYKKYTSTPADYDSVTLNTNKFHKPIAYDELLKSSRNVVNSSYIVFGKCIEAGKKVPVNNTITNLINFITYFSTPLNLSFKQYEKLILLKNKGSTEVRKGSLYSDNKYSITNISIKYASGLEYKECELLTIAIHGELVYSCCVKQRNFITCILKYIADSKGLLHVRGPKLSILNLLEPGYICGFRQNYCDVDMPKQLKDIIEKNRDEIKNIQMENYKLNIALPILGEGIIVTEVIEEEETKNSMKIAKIERDFDNIDKNHKSIISNYLFYGSRGNKDIIQLLES